MSAILDLVIIAIILIGAFNGWKYGGISAAVKLIGTILVFILAYYLKNPISVLLYENLPFFKFGGMFKGITSLNILLYEAIAFVIAMSLLTIAIAIIIKVTKVLDKIVNMTIILALPSKLLGLILGALQHYVIIYFVIFILLQIPFTSKYMNESTAAKMIADKTPGLSMVTKELYTTYNEVYDICVRYDNSTDKQKGDYEALDTLMKHEIITSKSVQKLKDKNKLEIDNLDELITKYNK
jgi:uncharacterized membrane protein required for colicin V production